MKATIKLFKALPISSIKLVPPDARKERALKKENSGLDKDDEELADSVLEAYKEAEGGTLRHWARRAFVRDAIRYEEWDVRYVKATEGTLLTVLCKMIKEGTFIKRIKEVKP